MSELPTYSELEELQDTGRPSAADETRQSFSAEANRRQAGAFGRAPEVQKQAQEADELEPVAPEFVLDTIAENVELRQRLEGAEAEVEFAAENELDRVAYDTDDYDSREEYTYAADRLLVDGGRDRLAYLLSDWREVDPFGAEAWVQDREYIATQALAQTSRQEAQQIQSAHEARYAKVLNDFQAHHPETKVGGVEHELIATSLQYDPNAFSSPAAFASSLETAYEHLDAVRKGYEQTAAVANFRSAFKQESIRHNGFHSPEARGTVSPYASQPGSDEMTLAAQILARSKPTQAQKQAALQQRDADFRAEFANAARGSGFGEGAREQAAAARRAQDEEDLRRRRRGH